MNTITDLQQLVGRTVVKTSQGCCDWLLLLDDGSIAKIEPTEIEGCPLLSLSAEVDADDLFWELGLIDKAEYERRVEQEDEQCDRRQEAHERGELARLIAKYGVPV